jgi:heavy metal translocating P-type ATPase
VRLVVALLMTVALAELSLTLASEPSWRFPGWQWPLLALAAPVVGWSAWPLHRAAWSGVRHGTASRDTLVSAGIIAATLWSAYTIVVNAGVGGGVREMISAPSGPVYLDVAAALTVFVLAGRLLEARATWPAGAASRALAALGAEEVALLRPDGWEFRIPVGGLRAGDRFVVRPGETVAADGVVESGQGALDVSAMTGEPVLAEIGPGDAVLGGTVSLSGRLVVRAGRVGDDTRLAGLIRLVEDTRARPIRGWFVPAVFAVALLTLVGRLAAGAAAETAFGTALAVLVIACPCALGRAIPTALLVASGRGAELGIFIREHRALEAARTVDTVVLGKTGTVTTGRMIVVGVATADGVTRAELLRQAGAVEGASEHAVAVAIVALARSRVGALPAVSDFNGLSGLGAAGLVEGRRILVGAARLMALQEIAVPPDLDALRVEWERRGRMPVLVAVDGTVRGVLALADPVRPSAADAVAELHAMGLRTLLLTGGDRATARAVAAQTGIGEVIAEVPPADRAAVITRLRGEGRSVAMVGDGIEDAPALARADLGLAGTAADLLLIREGLAAVPAALRLSRATSRTIRGNLVWAAGYHLAALPLAAAGLLGPLIAGLAMSTSSLVVVANSLRLRSIDGPAADAASLNDAL